MKKRKCRMSAHEREVHDFAVQVRKMTDQQLYDFVNQEPESKSDISAFIDKLETASISGIGPATIKKIKAFAVDEGVTLEN